MALGAEIPIIALFVTVVQIEVDAAYCLNFARVGTERNSQIFNFKFLFHIIPPIL